MKLAVIPARGGSKRIPRKNIKRFAGKPIIAYSIEAAHKSGLFDQIIVSTDDDEIAEVAKQYGADVPFMRSAELSGDHTGTMDVIVHAIQTVAKQQGETPEYTCCIYATAPFLLPEFLQQGYDKLSRSEYAYAFSVNEFGFPIQRALRVREDGALDAMHPEFRQTRSQDLERAYHDAGQFYWGRSDAFLSQQVLFSPSSVPVILPPHRVQDIDTPEDWVRAEYMYQALRLQEKK